MSRGELNTSKWLDAHSDGNAGLKVLPGGLLLTDVAGDGDNRLVILHISTNEGDKCKLKVYRGTVLCCELLLPDVPTGIISFYTDEIEPKIPAVAVVCSSELLMYKNNKPYFKFSIPTLPVTALEESVWKKLKSYSDSDSKSIIEAVEELNNVSYKLLSEQSQNMLNLPKEEWPEYVTIYKSNTLAKTSPVTCSTTINKNAIDPHAVSCPVIATEAGHMYIIDPSGFSVIHEASVSNVKSTPVLMKSTGLFDIEFRIFIACREKSVCLLRKGWLEGKIVFQTTADIVDMVIIPGDLFIMIATNDKYFHCYTKRGVKMWSLEMVKRVTCLCLVPLEHLSTHLVAVGLQGGLLHLYQGRYPVDYISVPGTPSAITFGQMGQEEHVMVVVTSSGVLNFKILKRTADFKSTTQDIHATPLNQNKPLPLPKRSRLFLEQSLREKQNAIDMHQNFQQDLIRLRLVAANAFVQNLNDQYGMGNATEQLKISAQILGLGDQYTLIITLKNMNDENPLTSLILVFHVPATVFRLSSHLIQIPLIPPGMSYKVEIKVKSLQNGQPLQIDPEDDNKRNIRVLIVKKKQRQPLLAATINMPASDVDML